MDRDLPFGRNLLLGTASGGSACPPGHEITAARRPDSIVGVECPVASLKSIGNDLRHEVIGKNLRNHRCRRVRYLALFPVQQIDRPQLADAPIAGIVDVDQVIRSVLVVRMDVAHRVSRVTIMERRPWLRMAVGELVEPPSLWSLLVGFRFSAADHPKGQQGRNRNMQYRRIRSCSSTFFICSEPGLIVRRPSWGDPLSRQVGKPVLPAVGRLMRPPSSSRRRPCHKPFLFPNTFPSLV